jgi:hypothetical protein
MIEEKATKKNEFFRFGTLEQTTPTNFFGKSVQNKSNFLTTERQSEDNNNLKNLTPANTNLNFQ